MGKAIGVLRFSLYNLIFDLHKKPGAAHSIIFYPCAAVPAFNLYGISLYFGYVCAVTILQTYPKE